MFRNEDGKTGMIPMSYVEDVAEAGFEINN